MAGSDTSEAPPSVRSLCWRILPRFVIGLGVWGGLLFGVAGTLSWLRGWVQLGLWLLTAVANVTILLRVNPAVVEARLNSKQITERFDRIIVPLLLAGTVAIPVLAGLDAVRYAWSAPPLWTLWLGIVLHAGGDAIMVWAMAVNPYSEGIVRVQTERGHHVISTGPYALVRHPMYTGGIILAAGMPLVLGSWWTFVLVGLLTAGLIIRTFFEENVLRRDLPGYEDYTRRTRCRLLPGVW